MSHLPTLHCLRLESWPIYKQLQLEEALLRTDQGNWCLINEGSPPAIVLGISGKVEELLDSKKLQEKPIPVIRRFSGGGTVIVDESTIFVTMICNRNAVAIAPFPRKILCWNGSLYHSLLQEEGFEVRENDYVMGDKKFGGNAQYICKERWLHHSTLLWDFNADNMDYLKLPPKMPTYRNRRSHSDFLCPLSPYLPNKQMFYDGLFDSLSQHFSLQTTPLQEMESCLNRPHRKSTKKIC